MSSKKWPWYVFAMQEDGWTNAVMIVDGSDWAKTGCYLIPVTTITIKILGSRAMGKPAPPRDYPRIKSGPNSSPKFGPVSSHKSLTVGTNTNGQLKCKIYNNSISTERRPLYMPSHQISNGNSKSNGNIKSNGQILAQLLREIKHLY